MGKFIVERKTVSAKTWSVVAKFDSWSEADNYVDEWSDYEDDDRSYKYLWWRVRRDGIESSGGGLDE